MFKHGLFLIKPIIMSRGVTNQTRAKPNIFSNCFKPTYSYIPIDGKCSHLCSNFYMNYMFTYMFHCLQPSSFAFLTCVVDCSY